MNHSHELEVALSDSIHAELNSFQVEEIHHQANNSYINLSVLPNDTFTEINQLANNMNINTSLDFTLEQPLNNGNPIPNLPQQTACRCGSFGHSRVNHSSCPLNNKENRNAYYLMARPDTYNIHLIVGKGICKDRESPHYGRHLLKSNKLQCHNCLALMFPEEKVSGPDDDPFFSICCSKHKFKLPPLRALPPLLKNLINPSTILGQDFCQKIRKYNSMFSFASFNANVGFF